MPIQNKPTTHRQPVACTTRFRHSVCPVACEASCKEVHSSDTGGPRSALGDSARPQVPHHCAQNPSKRVPSIMRAHVTLAAKPTHTTSCIELVRYSATQPLCPPAHTNSTSLPSHRSSGNAVHAATTLNSSPDTIAHTPQDATVCSCSTLAVKTVRGPGNTPPTCHSGQSKLHTNQQTFCTYVLQSCGQSTRTGLKTWSSSH